MRRVVVFEEVEDPGGDDEGEGVMELGLVIESLRNFKGCALTKLSLTDVFTRCECFASQVPRPTYISIFFLTIHFDQNHIRHCVQAKEEQRNEKRLETDLNPCENFLGLFFLKGVVYIVQGLLYLKRLLQVTSHASCE